MMPLKSPGRGARLEFVDWAAMMLFHIIGSETGNTYTNYDWINYNKSEFLYTSIGNSCSFKNSAVVTVAEGSHVQDLCW